MLPDLPSPLMGSGSYGILARRVTRYVGVSLHKENTDPV
jgi:hypothetical protein